METPIFAWNARSWVRSPRGGFAFHVFKLAVMIVQCSVPILKPVAKLCKMLHDRALKIVADFSLLFDYGPSEIQPMAKEGLYFKKIIAIHV